MTVNYETYDNEKTNFFKKHDNDFKVDTSSMDEYGRYWKTYTFEDGANWYEAMSPIEETSKIIIHECEVEVKVKFLRVEFWSSEFGSKYYYEQF